MHTHPLFRRHLSIIYVNDMQYKYKKISGTFAIERQQLKLSKTNGLKGRMSGRNLPVRMWKLRPYLLWLVLRARPVHLQHAVIPSTLGPTPWEPWTWSAWLYQESLSPSRQPVLNICSPCQYLWHKCLHIYMVYIYACQYTRYTLYTCQ